MQKIYYTVWRLCNCQQHGRAEVFAIFKTDDASTNKAAGRLHTTRI